MRQKSDYIIFNSNYMRDFYLMKYPFESSVASTICNIVDVETIDKEASHAIDEISFFQQHYVLLAVGRFCKEKGYNHLIRIFEKAREKKKDLGLVIIGDGELYSNVEEMVEESVYRNDILLLGKQKNPYKYMSKARLFLLTSISEGFPNVLLEALTLQLPVISTNCTSGPSEILDTRTNYYGNNNEIIYAEYGILAPSLEASSLYSGYNISVADSVFAEAILSVYDNHYMYEKYKSISRKRALDFSESAFRERFRKVLTKLVVNGEQ